MFLTQNIVLDLLGIFAALLAILAANHIWTLGYWKRRGVPGPGGIFLFGSMKDFFMSKKTMGDLFKDLYSEYKSKGVRYFGCYFSGAPTFVPIDIELVRSMLHADFQSHGFYYNEDIDPASSNMFFLDGQRWKEVRSKLTSAFTPGKLKLMHQGFIEVSLILKKVLDESSKLGCVDIKNIMSCFTTDVIGNCAFGLDTDSLENPDIDFRKFGDQIITPNFRNGMRLALPLFIPHNILRAFNFRPLDPKSSDFYQDTVLSTVQYREENNVTRSDFMDLLIKMKNNTDEENRLSVNEIIGQCFIFYVAGFETSSTTLTFATFEIAQNQYVQKRLREEINKVLSKHNNELTYEALQEMEYLDQVVCESLRKHPPIPALMRRCTKNYKIPGEDLIIKKGTLVFIPIRGIQHDPEYYPNPDKFDPDRFSAENKKTRPALSWLPFGEGPRICIGMRFGMQQVKIGLITIIQNFNVSLSENTKLPLKFSKLSPLLKCDEEIWMNLEKIST